MPPPMLTIDADALSTIVARVSPEDQFPLALVHTTLRDACLRHKANAHDGVSKEMWTTRATSSVKRATWAIQDFGLTPTRWWCSEAAAGGHLDVLKWLRNEGCPWDEWTCSAAANVGHLEVLKWLRKENDPPCPWDEWTCSNAAEYGHLEVLKWLRNEGCPWDESTCSAAAS